MVSIAIAVACPSWAEDRRGEPFGNPSHIQPMSPRWQEQRVVREPGVGGIPDLAVTLDQHLYPILLPFINEYSGREGIEISVEKGTCGISAGRLAKKTVDIGGYCCPPGDTDRLPGLMFHTLGIAPIAIIVNPENPLESLSEEEVRDVFQGHVSHWSELGWDEGGAILPVGRLHCKQRPGHWKLILGAEDRFSPSMQEVSTIPDMIYLVSSAHEAIGYEATFMARLLRDEWKVKELRINGKSPDDVGALVSGDYPFYRTMDITTWEGAAADPHAKGLAEYLVKRFEEVPDKGGIVPASTLRKIGGWKFAGDELVGEPVN